MRRPAPTPNFVAEAIRFGVSRSEARRLWALSAPRRGLSRAEMMTPMDYDLVRTMEARAAEARDAMRDAPTDDLRQYYHVVASNAQAEATFARVGADSWNDRAAKMRAYVEWMNEPEMEAA